MTALPTVSSHRVAMPDGVRLATEVVRPSGRAPTVLLRTYLGRTRHFDEGRAWAGEGFAFVAQDVRGRYGSQGEWDPCVHERADGAAALAWVAEQPWCDGRVALVGGSYAAFTAWAAALSGHPAARAVVALVPAMDRVHFAPGGVLKLYNHAHWWLTHGESATERAGLADALLADPGLLRHLPVADLPRRFPVALRRWTAEVLAGPAPEAPWRIRDEELAACPLATLHVGGWHDPFVRTTVHQWQVAGSALSPRPRRGLVLGPWTHALLCHLPARCGERDYGPASRFALGRFEAAWLRAAMGLAEEPAEPRARVFLAGANRWLAADEWPPAAAPRTWYAGPGGRLVAAPEEAGSDSFVHDPEDPFPARTAPVDQSDLAARPDALRYATGPLPEPLTVQGSPVVELWTSCEAPAADWVARLHEALPDGRTLYLGHALAVSAGGALRLELPPLAVTVPAGHGLCLEVTGSSFPEYARNLNTGACRSTTAEVRRARQTLCYGPAAPTALTLPAAAAAEEPS